MPQVTEWNARMGPQQRAIAFSSPGNTERVHVSVLLTKLDSSRVRGLEPAPQRDENGQTHAITKLVKPEKTDGSAMCFNNAANNAILSGAIEPGPVKHRKWAAVEEEFADVPSNNE